MPSGLALVLRYGLWAAGTGGLLLAVDSLECVLHVVRLHWVEFMNQFYRGGGFLYRPLRLIWIGPDRDIS